MNDYYDVNLKNSRLEKLTKYKNFNFEQYDIANLKKVTSSFKNFSPDKVVNLAAQAGVRYSINNPNLYIESNIVGFMNILECCRYNNIKGLIYASSSSVYGGNQKIPFSVEDEVNKPLSIYAATKRSNELMAYSYSSLYGINITGLRFFTVYGPWGRPDMAMYIFADKISKGERISVFNHGKMKRDFTYISDIISGIRASIKYNFKQEIFNLGNNKSEDISNMIRQIEKGLDKKARIDFKGMQLGDVQNTYANIEYSKSKLQYKPLVSLNEGISEFINWFNSYYNNT